MNKISAVTILFFAICSSGNSNILRNSSFEEKKLNHWQYISKSEFSVKSEKGIDSSNCLELKKGCVYQTLYHSYLYPDQETGPQGRFYSFSFMAKGKGELEFKLAEFSKDLKGKYKYKDTLSKKVKLSEKWQKFEITGMAKDPRCVYHRVLWQKTSQEGYALIDNADFHYFQSPDFKMEISPQCAVAAKGDEIPIEISLYKKSIPCPQQNTNITVFNSLKDFGGEIKVLSGKTDNKGVFRYTLKIPKNFSSDGIRISVSVPDFGVKRNIFIPVFSEKQKKDTDKIASGIKLNKKLFILYLGDSLSDYLRGRNYTDMVNYYLNKYNKGKAFYKNAAVGGDFITRIWKRIGGMKQGESAWRQYMYENLLTPKPDIIFIFLGHNDTKTFSKTNYLKPAVLPDAQYYAFKKLISFLRKNTNAKIVLLSSVSIYFPAQSKRMEELQKKGTPHCLFGQKEHLENFNSTLKKIAKEEKLDCIDVYSTTQKHTDKKALFISDGLHLSKKGNLLITKTIINYINKKIKGDL
jgi:lysophospholipase L1-like esterase